MTALALAPDSSARDAGDGDLSPDWQACTRWDAAADPLAGGRAAGKPRLGRSDMLLGGVQCAACSGIVEDLLRPLPGVLAVSASAASGRVSLRWDAALTHPSRWNAALRPAGYSLAPDHGGSARALRQAESRNALWRCFVAALCSMQIMMLAAPSYGAAANDLAPEWARILNWGQWVLALPVLLFSARPLFAAAVGALRQRRVAMELPAVLGIGVAFVASTVATFEPEGVLGSDVYFDSLTMFVTLLLGARALQLRVRHRAAERLEAQWEAVPQGAWRVDAGGRPRLVPRAELRVGDELAVPSGEAVPADGELLHGQALVDEALLNGESRAIAKCAGAGEGARLWAGSLNQGPPLRMRVLAIGDDTRVAAIGELLRQAQHERPSSWRLAERWAMPFTVAVLLAAAGAALVLWSTSPPAALRAAVAVLIVTCPCALALAVPAAQLAAVQALARHGVIVRRIAAVERLAEVTSVVFDKTGTLTESGHDDVRLALLRGTEGEAADQARRCWAHAAALAQASSHPLSRALTLRARADEVVAAELHEVSESAGRGLQGFDADGRCWRLGSAGWTQASEGGAHDASASAWLSCDGRVLAAVYVDEVVRADAAAALSRLAAAGLKIRLISGDVRDRVRVLAARLAPTLGCDDVVCTADPERKLAELAAMQQRGEVVMMVGDGFNDAPVLARADVSVAMGHAVAASQRAADLVLDSQRPDALAGLPAARLVARRARQVSRQNLWWAAAYNAACIPLALAGWLPPWAAGLGMAASSALVVANSARLTRA